MNDTFASIINELCANKQDMGIYLLKFDRTSSGHPTTAENKKYTQVLLDYLKNTVLK